MYKDRLKEYIKNDVIFNSFKQNPNKKINDFEEFCLEHVLDIKFLLQENEDLQCQLEKKENNIRLDQTKKILKY